MIRPLALAALVLSAAPAAGQEEPPAADSAALTFEDLYGRDRLDLNGKIPGGLRWVGPDRYLDPNRTGDDLNGPAVVLAETGDAAAAYDAAGPGRRPQSRRGPGEPRRSLRQ